ncbi:MAG: 6-bladed beta-propeller [Microscillaceae bacterium]|nr:6-bladed beta-propeller [Microscillaceae bacterium]
MFNKASIHFYYFLILFLSVSCSYDTKDQTRLTPDFQIDISLNDIKKNIKYSDFIDQYDFVKLETSENSLIGSIDEIRCSKQYIFILDMFISKGVFQFDRKGRFIRRVGKVGEGPGEYTSPISFTIHEKKSKIFILDNRQKILCFNFDGGYIEQIRSKGFLTEKIELLDDNRWAFIGGGTEDHVVMADSQLNKIKSYLPFLNRATSALIPNAIFKLGEDILVRRDYLDTVYAVTKTEIRPHIIFNFKDKSLPFEMIAKNQENPSITALSNDYCIVRFYYELKDYIYLGFIHKSNAYIVNYNKLNRSGILFSFNDIKDDITFLDNKFNSYIVGVDLITSRFIYKVETQDFIQGVESAQKQHAEGEAFIKARGLAKQLKTDDNPVLMFAKYANF